MLLFMDVETGGIDPKTTDLLTAFFAVTDLEGEVYNTLDVKLKPESGIYRVTPDALQVNGIDLCSHNKEATERYEAERQLTLMLDKYKTGEQFIPVGWNVGFDVSFVKEQLISQMMWNMFVSYRNLDLQAVYQFLYLSGKYKVSPSLSKVATYFGLDVSGQHDAKFDVELTIEVYKKMRKDMKYVG